MGGGGATIASTLHLPCILNRVKSLFFDQPQILTVWWDKYNLLVGVKISTL